MPTKSIIPDSSASFTRGLNEGSQNAISTALSELEERKKRDDFDKRKNAFISLTQNPLAGPAFEAAKGNPKQAREHLAFGQLFRDAIVDSSTISKQELLSTLSQQGVPEEKIKEVLEDPEKVKRMQEVIAEEKSKKNLSSLSKQDPDALIVQSQARNAKEADAIRGKSDEASRQLNQVLPLLKEVINSGDLPSGTNFSLFSQLVNDEFAQSQLDNTSLDVLLASQKDFLTGIKNVFPGRVTNLDVSLYLKRFPSIFQTDTGRKLIYQSVETAAKWSELEGTITDEILRDFRAQGGTRYQQFPTDLLGIVRQRMASDPRSTRLLKENNETLNQLTSLEKSIGSDENHQESFNNLVSEYKNLDTTTDAVSGGADIKRLGEIYRAVIHDGNALNKPRLFKLPSGKRYIIYRQGSGLQIKKAKKKSDA